MLSSKYKFSQEETFLLSLWSEELLYSYNPDDKSKVFSIDTPPPGISGSLHLGHVYSYTHTDFIARYYRQKGYSVFYPIGFDNNGLPTERLVEKEKKIIAQQLSHQEFKDACQSVINKYIPRYKEVFSRIGLSFDWQLEYDTISQDSVKLSQSFFVELFSNGILERKESACLFDVVDQTAIAQAELEDIEKTGIMYEIKFNKECVIATTRPELLPAIQAVFYHPEDDRYIHLSGTKVKVPLVDKEVLILPDHEVKLEKGTGLVMCCTFGDMQDLLWQKRHSLNITKCITKSGRMQNSGKYDGLKIKEARAAIIEDLGENVLNRKEIVHTVKCAERSKSPIEIILEKQWYIKVLDRKEEILKRSKEIVFYPESMRKRLEIWIEGLNQDWCISRQRFFGVPFPIWYSKRKGEEGKIIVAISDILPVDPNVTPPPGYNMEEVIPERDVMDTWATSSLTPQINMEKQNKDKLFPFSLRPQAHEIIRTWAFYTIVRSIYHNSNIPWFNIAISGWCLAHDKAKMSKSKGNVVDPMKVFEEYSADAVRYWAAKSKLGVDTAVSYEIMKVGKKLSNKLWSAARFVEMHVKDIKNYDNFDEITNKVDLWLISLFNELILRVEKAFESYTHYIALEEVEEFFMKIFCDNYLELIKKRVYQGEDKEKRSAVLTLYLVLKGLLQLFAPFLIFVTDKISRTLYNISVHSKGAWPCLIDVENSKSFVKQGEYVLSLLELIRKSKTERKLSLNSEYNNVILSAPEEIEGDFIEALQAAGCIKNIKLRKEGESCDIEIVE